MNKTEPNRLADIDTPTTLLLRAKRLARQAEAYASECDRLTEETETLLLRAERLIAEQVNDREIFGVGPVASH